MYRARQREAVPESRMIVGENIAFPMWHADHQKIVDRRIASALEARVYIGDAAEETEVRRYGALRVKLGAPIRLRTGDSEEIGRHIGFGQRARHPAAVERDDEIRIERILGADLIHRVVMGRHEDIGC